MTGERIDHARHALETLSYVDQLPTDDPGRRLSASLEALTHAVLDVADAYREASVIDVEIAEAINTPGGILDTLAPMSLEELEGWAASLPAGPPRSLLAGLAAIKRSEDR